MKQQQPPQSKQLLLSYMDHVVQEMTTLLHVFQTDIIITTSTTTPFTTNHDELQKKTNDQNQNNKNDDDDDDDTNPELATDDDHDDDHCTMTHLPTNLTTATTHPSHSGVVPNCIHVPASMMTAIRARAHYRRSQARYYQWQLWLRSQQEQQEIHMVPSFPNNETSNTNAHSNHQDHHTHHQSSVVLQQRDKNHLKDLPDSDNDSHDTNTTTTTTTSNSSNSSNSMTNVDDLEQSMYQDLRMAAYMGDKKAVSWYGHLMRRHRNSGSTHGGDGDHVGMGGLSSSLSSSSSKSPPHSPFDPSHDSTRNYLETRVLSPSMDFVATDSLSSLFTGCGAGGDTNDNHISTTNNGGGPAISLLSQMFMNSMSSSSSSLPGSGTRSSNGSVNPVQAFVQSMLKRVTNDVQFQSTICQFLQNVSLPQIQQYMQLFGVSNLVTLPTKYMQPIIQFCHAITLIRLQRIIFITKCMNYCRQIIQRILRLLHKYHTIIVLYFVNVWIQSSVKRPIPISKKTPRQLHTNTSPLPPLQIR